MRPERSARDNFSRDMRRDKKEDGTGYGFTGSAPFCCMPDGAMGTKQLNLGVRMCILDYVCYT